VRWCYAWDGISRGCTDFTQVRLENQGAGNQPLHSFVCLTVYACIYCILINGSARFTGPVCDRWFSNYYALPTRQHIFITSWTTTWILLQCRWLLSITVYYWYITIGATLYVTMVTCHHHFWKWWWLSPPLFQSGIYTLGKRNRIFLATRSVLWPKICRKCDSGRSSAPDPAVGAHNAPPDAYSRLGSGHPSPYPTPLGASAHLRRLDHRAPLTPNPGDATGHHHFLR